MSIIITKTLMKQHLMEVFNLTIEELSIKYFDTVFDSSTSLNEDEMIDTIKTLILKLIRVYNNETNDIENIFIKSKECEMYNKTYSVDGCEKIINNEKMKYIIQGGVQDLIKMYLEMYKDILNQRNSN